MSKTYEELYKLAIGVVSTWKIDSIEEFNIEFEELDNNNDMTYIGCYSSTQDIDEEFQHQGLSLDDITKFSMNRYGTVIEVLEFNNEYHVFYGSR